MYTLISLIHETANSHNLEAANHMAHIIFVLHNAMKIHLLTNQNACTIQLISYIILLCNCVKRQKITK